jgi:subtilisin family serine protease
LTRPNGESIALAPGTAPLRGGLSRLVNSSVVDDRLWVSVHLGLRPGASRHKRLVRLVTEQGGRVRGRLGDVWSVLVPAGAVLEVARSDSVEWLKGARRPRLMTETSTGPLHVDSDGVASIFGAPGDGVILAVLDTGIDWTHPDFRNPDGSTRLLGI